MLPPCRRCRLLIRGAAAAALLLLTAHWLPAAPGAKPQAAYKPGPLLEKFLDGPM